MRNIAVLITVFNRKDITLKGISQLYFAIQQISGYCFDIFLTDDGCTDGTASAVKEKYPEVRILQGNGKLYWGGGMRKAWENAVLSKKKYNYFLWFNDDADLFPTALKSLLQAAEQTNERAIICGAFCNHEGEVSYGGRDMFSNLIKPNGSLQSIKYMNGNFVLIPHYVYDKIGMIDSVFCHGYGDYDYGLRAQKNGIPVFMTKEYIGITDRHDGDLTLWNSNIPFNKRMEKLWTVKYNPNILFHYYCRHFGLWIAFKRYVETVLYTLFPDLQYFIKQ